MGCLETDDWILVVDVTGPLKLEEPLALALTHFGLGLIFNLSFGVEEAL